MELGRSGEPWAPAG